MWPSRILIILITKQLHVNVSNMLMVYGCVVWDSVPHPRLPLKRRGRKLARKGTEQMAGSFIHIINEHGEFIGQELLDGGSRDTLEALMDCYDLIYALSGGSMGKINCCKKQINPNCKYTLIEANLVEREGKYLHHGLV